jgi:hypothetical protein
MQTQSLLFSRAEGWTVEKAKVWAKKHGHKSNKVDVTDQYVRLRQLDPKGFQVKRTVPFGKGIRAVVAREETMAAKKKTTRRPAAKRTAARRKPAAKPKAPPKRRTAPKKSKPATTRVVSARRPARKVRASGRRATEARRPKKRAVRAQTKRTYARAKSKVAESRRPKKRAVSRKPSGQVMAKRKVRSTRSKGRRTVQAWHGDSAGHSKAAKKGWKTRKAGKPSKPSKASRTTKTAAESRRPKRRTTRETPRVAATRRPTKRTYARAKSKVAESRRPAKKRGSSRRVREATRVASPRSYRKSRVVRAPSLGSIARTAGQMGAEIGTAVAGYLIADGIDRFLATYDPSGTAKPANKFTSDGAGTLANALNVASPPDMWRYGALAAMTLVPLGGSLLAKNPMVRAGVEGIGLGAGVKLFTTLWSHVLMPMLVGKDTSVPALRKSWIARLYPAEVSASLNIKSGKADVSSGGATSTAGTLSGGSDRDAGPFALGDRFARGRGDRHDWVAPSPWPTAAVPAAPAYDPSIVDTSIPAPPVQPAWPARWGEHHRWGLRGVGDAVQDMTATIAAQTGVHPAHAVNAAMHAAAEPADLTQALQRALPHVNRDVLRETARHLHPHVVRMHLHSRYPREHGEWESERAGEGFPAPDHDAPEQEWREWHGKRAAAGLPQAPPPPEPPPLTPATPVHLRTRFEWQPKSGREITSDRYPTTQQVLGIGAPYASGNPGQPGLGEAFSDAVQTVAATVPDMPLENAVNATAFAAAEPCNLVRAFERAMPQIRRELARQCAVRVDPYIRTIHDQTGVPLPAAPGAPAAPAPGLPAAPPAVPGAPLSLAPLFKPSPPPPSWTRSEAEWHVQEKSDWDRSHASPVVVAAATQAAQAAAAPHPDADHPAVQAAVQAVADHAAQVATSAPPGTPPADVHAAATQAAQSVAADDHPAVANHPAVQAAIQAAATAATAAAPAANAAAPAPAVTAAATQAAQSAAAPHADANKPAVAAAVQAAANGAAQAAAAAPPGTPTAVVQQAAKDGAQAAAAAHGAAADHPAVQAAVKAAAPAAANAAAPAAGTSGVGFPPRNLQIGPTKLPKPQGPQPPESDCGCLNDSPYLGFVGEEEETDLLYTN